MTPSGPSFLQTCLGTKFHPMHGVGLNFYVCFAQGMDHVSQRRWRHLHSRLVTPRQSFSMGCQTKKKETSCSHRKSTSPSVRSLGDFKRFSALISWGLSTGWSLSFVTFAVTSWESLLEEWHVPGGLVGHNEPSVAVPFALPSSICWY